MEYHTLSGDLTISDILSALGLDDLSDFENRNSWLVDFADARVNASPAEVRQQAIRLRDYQQKHKPDQRFLLAAAAEDDVTFGLLRIFVVYAECSNSRFHVCRDFQEAKTWMERSALGS